MGGTYIAMIPGGDPESLRDGDQILDTQGSVDLMQMVGQFINQSGGEGEGGDAASGSGSSLEEPSDDFGVLSEDDSL